MKGLAKWVANYDDENSLASRFRAKRLFHLTDQIESVFKAKGSVRILDVGGTRSFWRIVPDEYLASRRLSVVLTNLDVPDDAISDSIFTHVKSDACSMDQIGDQEFDIAHSNSVIEHVGDWEHMRAFSREIKRVARRYVVQTPNYWFPIEPHCFTPFFHWLPEPTKMMLVTRFQLGHWKKATTVSEAIHIVQSARLLTADMFADLFPDAEFHRERFLGWTKSFTIVGG